MNIDITAEDDTTVEFDIEGVSVEFANALRRTMIGDVPTLAVEDVSITANDSGLFDEILAHRLGMTPFTVDLDNHVMTADCDCDDGCTKCEVSMALQQEGPGTVTADDISIPAEDVEPANPETRIVDLKEDRELDMELTAQLGRGKDHAKWQAANASYSYEDGTFHFTVESVSGHDPRTIVIEAVAQLEQDLDAFEAAVGEAL